MIAGKRHPFAGSAFAVPALLACALAFAQWRVDNRVGQVNNRVGGELYGNNTNMGTIRYAAQMQTTLLPSEARYATWRSGALPSEIAMNAAAVGPLSPNGAIGYIPTRSPVQAAMKMPEMPLYTNNYSAIKTSQANALLPAQAGFGASNTIRYSTPAPAAGAVPNFSTGQTAPRTVTPAAIPSASGALPIRRSYVECFTQGSVRYSGLAKPTP